jgi:hypothetical protein
MSYVESMQPHGPNSTFLWPHRDDCCWIEYKIQLVILAVNETCQTYKMSPELLFDIEKKHRIGLFCNFE